MNDKIETKIEQVQIEEAEFSEDSFDEQDLDEHGFVDAKCSTMVTCASRQLIQKDHKKVTGRYFIP